MTAVVCACCGTPRPVGEVYERLPGSGEWFYRDTAGCRKRMAYAGDPVGEFIPSPPPAVSGAACSVCAAVDPPGGAYERSAGIFLCRDRAGCAARSVETQYLTAQSDQSPDALISSADMRHMVSAAGAQTPPEPAVLTPAQRRALAAADSLGRRTVAADGALEARIAAIARP